MYVRRLCMMLQADSFDRVQHAVATVSTEICLGVLQAPLQLTTLRLQAAAQPAATARAQVRGPIPCCLRSLYFITYTAVMPRVYRLCTFRVIRGWQH